MQTASVPCRDVHHKKAAACHLFNTARARSACSSSGCVDSPNDLPSFVMKNASSPSLLAFCGLGMQAPPVSRRNSGPLPQHDHKCFRVTNTAA